jgi:hypothetical protein
VYRTARTVATSTLTGLDFYESRNPPALGGAVLCTEIVVVRNKTYMKSSLCVELFHQDIRPSYAATCSRTTNTSTTSNIHLYAYWKLYPSFRNVTNTQSHPYMTQHGSQITYLFLVPSHIIPTNSAAYTYCGTYRNFAYQTIRYKHGQLRTGLLARFLAQTQHSLQGRAKRALSLATGQTWRNYWRHKTPGKSGHFLCIRRISCGYLRITTR